MGGSRKFRRTVLMRDVIGKANKSQRVHKDIKWPKEAELRPRRPTRGPGGRGGWLLLSDAEPRSLTRSICRLAGLQELLYLFYILVGQYIRLPELLTL